MLSPPSGLPPSGRSRTFVIVLGGAVAAVLLSAGVVALAVHGQAGTTASTIQQPAPVEQPTTSVALAPDPTFPADETTTPVTEEPTVDPEQAALDQLATIHDQDLPTVSPHGQYVAQLASKNPGIADKYQTAADGSHTFTAADILAEHENLRNGPNEPARVVLLKSTDYGKRQIYNGQPLWVTFAIGSFPSPAAVKSWCAKRFPDLSGDELANQCAVRRLEP